MSSTRRERTRPSFRVTRTSALNCASASSAMSGCGKAAVLANSAWMRGSKCASPSKSAIRTAPSSRARATAYCTLKLGLERRLRAGIVGVRQAAAVRHDLDLRRVVGADAFLLAEREHHGNSRVGAAAARKLLEAHGLAGALERVGPMIEDLVGVIVAGAVEGVEEPLLVLEHGRVGVVAGFGEQGGEQAVAGGLADMQGFDHGAKIGLHARGEGGRNGEGNGK